MQQSEGYAFKLWLTGLLCCLLSVNASASNQPFDVIAIEYPPFTSSNSANQGIAFQMLRATFPHYRFRAQILPPKRAFSTLQQGQWCLSFFPPPVGVATDKIELSTDEVSIGLIRVRQEGDFAWQKLTDLSGTTIAILRTGESSEFSRQFLDAGLQVIFTETIQQAAELVLKGRVDLAIYDNYNFAQLNAEMQSRLQFSTTYLLETPITLFSNPFCQYQLTAPRKNDRNQQALILRGL